MYPCEKIHAANTKTKYQKIRVGKQVKIPKYVNKASFGLQLMIPIFNGKSPGYFTQFH